MMKKPLSLSFDNTAHAFAYKSDKDLKKSYQIFSMMRYPWLVKAGSVLAPIALKWKLPIKGLIQHTIFQQFCGGKTLEEVAATASKLYQYNVGCALDYGVEAVKGEDNYENSVKALQTAIIYAGNQKGIPMISLKATGFARFDLLEKVHAQISLNKEEKEEWKRIVQRIDTICKTANEHQISVLIDAEESWIQYAVDTLALQMMERYNKERCTVFNTYQLYLHERLSLLKKHGEESFAKGYLLGVKIVRGAYMEKERKRAKEKGYPSPIQPDKEATDRDYNQAITWSLTNIEKLSLFIGTHNEYSCMLAAQYLHEHDIAHNHPHVRFSQLYGMSDNITFNLADAGYNVSKFLPYGAIQDVLPYLIRRSEENSSISGQMGRELFFLKKELKRRK